MPITFYLYANNEQEVRDLERALYEFVMAHYRAGVPVTAAGVKSAVENYGQGTLVRSFLRNNG